MKTWICTTLASFFGPMQGAARLYAYIRKQGHDVSLKDLNQDAYFTLLSRKYLGACLDRLKSNADMVAKSQFLRQDLGSILSHGSGHCIESLLARGVSPHSPSFGNSSTRLTADDILYALLSESEFVISEIERARKTLDEKFLSLAPEEFLASFQTLLCGKAIMDTTYFPAQLDFGLGFHGTAYAPSVRDILQAVNDEKHNFLIQYFRGEVVPLLKKESPEIVGISITHTSDFVPAFTLASIIKSEEPEIHVVLGGATLTEVAYRLAKNLPLWNYFDSLVLGPGEQAFSQLIERIQTGRDLSQVPNVMYKEKGSIKESDRLHEFDINDACTPEYVSVRPNSGLPLETASGCYWGKCIFCYYPKIGSSTLSSRYEKKRVRRLELVLDDIRKLKEWYDPVYIGFTDSSLHPRRLEQIVEQNLMSGKKTHFTAFVRFEKEFTDPEFCQKLANGGFVGGQVGLESGSPRVNDIINKGIELDDARIIMKNCYQAGILVHLYAVVGVPGETREEALMTYNFIRRWHRWLTLGWQVYPLYVLEHGPIAESAAQFGIKATPLPDEFLSQVMSYEMEKGLSPEESLNLSISFSEKLKPFMHPLHQIMDAESHKIFLLVQKAKGIAPETIGSLLRVGKKAPRE